MFEIVFNSYERDVLSKLHKGRTTTKWIVLMLPILALAPIPIFYNYFNEWLALTPLAIFSLSILISHFYFRNIKTRLHEEYPAAVSKLIDFLKSDDKEYNLYSSAKIDWLINCCREKLKRQADKMLWFLFPVVMATILIALADPLRPADATQIFYLASRSFFTLAFVIGCAFSVRAVLSNILMPNRFECQRFYDDLGYLKATAVFGNE